MRISSLRQALLASVVLAALGLGACAHKDIYALQEPQGFRGVAWGSAPAAELRQVGEEGEDRCYVREGERYRVGDVEVQNIYYCFFKNAFYHARVEFAPENLSGVKTLLYLKYGAPLLQEGDEGEGDDPALRSLWDFSDSRITLSNRGYVNYYFKPGLSAWMRGIGIFDDI